MDGEEPPASELEMMTAAVEATLHKHMHDPKLLPSDSPPRPSFRPLQNYTLRTTEQLAKDLTVAHDRIRTLTRIQNENAVKVDKAVQVCQRRIVVLGWIALLFAVSSLVQWAGIIDLLR